MPLHWCIEAGAIVRTGGEGRESRDVRGPVPPGPLCRNQAEGSRRRPAFCQARRPGRFKQSAVSSRLQDAKVAINCGNLRKMTARRRCEATPHGALNGSSSHCRGLSKGPFEWRMARRGANVRHPPGQARTALQSARLPQGPCPDETQDRTADLRQFGENWWRLTAMPLPWSRS
jgi:hypothetical protein